MADIHCPEFSRRRARDRSIHAEHENQVGGPGELQAASRRDAAGWGCIGMDRQKATSSRMQKSIRCQPDMMVIEMIEETFNQPFKTGPLIDQQGNYALFDILMNRQMFDYIKKHKLYSKAEQESAANSNLRVDFPAGVNPPDGQVEGGDPGGI